MIVDAHLDLAYNALRGRPVHLPASQQKPDDDGTPTTGLPDLREGNVRLICATLYCEPCINNGPGYRDADQARVAALAQLAWYRARESDGSMRFVRSAKDLSQLPPDTTSAILLMEGADPIRTPTDVHWWFEQGLRIVGLAWKKTRYAGGTGAPGPLTKEGVELVAEFDRFGIIQDASHLAEQSFWQLLEISSGPVIATHSNCRSIVPTDRQLSDEMIRAIAARGGVIGINFFEKFLLPPGEYKKRRATLADLVLHIRTMCDLLGNCNHVAIGTDLDGGFGAEDIPVEILTAADMPKVAEALASAKFSSEDANKIMSQNWLNFFKKNLPA